MKKLLALIPVAALLVIASCRKDDNNPSTPSGKGGNATIQATPQHHGKNIDSCTVYIKYNTSDAPADGKYDDSAVCLQIGNKPVATFTQLKKGPYYLYGRGWDTSISQTVVGGIPYNVPDTIVNAYPVNVPVTEGD
jgi:hypothetical protein